MANESFARQLRQVSPWSLPKKDARRTAIARMLCHLRTGRWGRARTANDWVMLVDWSTFLTCQVDAVRRERVGKVPAPAMYEIPPHAEGKRRWHIVRRNGALLAVKSRQGGDEPVGTRWSDEDDHPDFVLGAWCAEYPDRFTLEYQAAMKQAVLPMAAAAPATS